MKYGLFGDLHGADLEYFEKVLDSENIDWLFCTGDFDQIKTIHQFIDLEKKYNQAGKKVTKVPGNHDHAILNNLQIRSGTLSKQGKNISQLHRELIRDPIAFEYIKKLVNSGEVNLGEKIFIDENKFNRLYPTVLMHGACDGDLSSFPHCPKNIRHLWRRLRTKYDYKKNFNIMDKIGYKIMIRGHDHQALYAHEGYFRGIVFNEPKPNESEYPLFGYRKHIINPGALFDGFFATIETTPFGDKIPILKYKKL